MKKRKASPRVLFILKFRQGYDEKPEYSNGYFSSGLFWSAKFVVDMLVAAGIDAQLVQVVDNNDIDREVSKADPDIVIIEALWVVPEKFDILKKLHPKVRWIVRLHSNMPFLAQEGIAIAWIKEYDARGVEIAANERRIVGELHSVIRHPAIYLPNYYPLMPITARKSNDAQHIHIASYGAVRPLKNQLLQATAAIRFADENNLVLHFHVNGTRIEAGGKSVLANLKSLFTGMPHFLVEDEWVSHSDFLKNLVRIDIGMQVSLSETFSIVAADMVSVGIPIVVSPEIGWAAAISKVDAANSDSVVSGLARADNFRCLNIKLNRRRLTAFDKQSKKTWLDFLED